MKRRILQFLRQAPDAVSGEQMSAALGVSRVTVWKHIRGLQEAGYEITAGPKGYRLAADQDLLRPWEFAGREDRMHCFEALDSTMRRARDLARRGCPPFTVVTADRQTGGRGRLGRAWHSPEGGLYFTVVLRPTLPAALSSLTTFAAGLTWVRLLREERKLSGMLSEMEARGEMLTFVNIGIGLNVNGAPGNRVPGAVSLVEVVGRRLSRRELLAGFLDRFERCMEAPRSLDGVIAAWKPYAVTLNRAVRIVTTRETVEGIARDVDETGALLLERDDGRLQRILHGDCFHQT